MGIWVNGSVFGAVSVSFGRFCRRFSELFDNDFGFRAPVGGPPETGVEPPEILVEEFQHCDEVGLGRGGLFCQCLIA